MRATVIDPITIGLAIESCKGKPISVTANKKVNLSITIILPGSELPLLIRGVEFIVLEAETVEALLGRPLLHAIRFDLLDHLRNVAGEISEKSIQELENRQNTLASLPYKGHSYHGVDDDPIKPRESLVTGLVTDSGKEIEE